MDSDDQVTPPASFPHQPVQEIQEIAPPSKVSEEDLKNVCEGLRCQISARARVDTSCA
jgi:hypothetical protein